jgi:predicted esterase
MSEEIRLVSTTIHGRILVRKAGSSRGVLLGFHGYKEQARIQMDRLAAIPGVEGWTLVSIQALHRFYLGRTDEVVASWMTREDREAMLADNIAYMNAAMASLDVPDSLRIVCAGYSQGVAMAFRTAVRGTRRAAAIVGVGGDVPPELISDPAVEFPPVLLVRGARDPWYAQPTFEADESALAGRRVLVRARVVDGAHEWNDAVSGAVGEFLAGLE